MQRFVRQTAKQPPWDDSQTPRSAHAWDVTEGENLQGGVDSQQPPKRAV